MAPFLACFANYYQSQVLHDCDSGMLIITNHKYCMTVIVVCMQEESASQDVTPTVFVTTHPSQLSSREGTSAGAWLQCLSHQQFYISSLSYG